MSTPKKTDPLTIEEVLEASELFFPLFQTVLDRSPDGTSTEEALKLAEVIFTYAHKLRAIKAEKASAQPFGFNKPTEEPNQ